MSDFLPTSTPFSLQTVYLIPPGVSEYAGEHCLLNCYPVLHSHGISDLTKAPCLSALLKNLHHILLDQYTYEEVHVCVCTVGSVCVCIREGGECVNERKRQWGENCDFFNITSISQVILLFL